jgi:hypothetical protein
VAWVALVLVARSDFHRIPQGQPRRSQFKVKPDDRTGETIGDEGLHLVSFMRASDRRRMTKIEVIGIRK